MKRFALLVTILGLFTSALFLTSAQAGKSKIYKTSSGVAINGTDPVGYFKQHRPVAGKSDITHKWNGATWRFANTKNRDLFAANPAKYAPQFGGYCAWAVSKGYTASTSPAAWSIVGGKLYLNYSKSVRSRWEKDKSTNISKGRKNWPKVLN